MRTTWRVTLVGAAMAMAMAGVGIACGDAGGASTFRGGADGGRGAPGDPGGGGPGGQFGDGGGGSGDGGLDPDAACAATVAEPKRNGVDIVFVVDNSHSMADEIRKVQANINQFSSRIASSGLDYRVIMISAKGTVLDDDRQDVANLKGCGVSGDYPREICVPPPLGGAACGDNAPSFFHLDPFPYGVASTNALSLILGTYPPSYRFACPSLSPPQPSDGGWQKWARADAMKFFVAISDDDAETPAPLATDGGAPAEEVHQAFDRKLLTELSPLGMFGSAQQRKYVYNAIVGWSGYPGGEAAPAGGEYGTGCVARNAAGVIVNYAMNQGEQHQKLSRLTGGVVDSICKEDWSPVLANLAQQVVSRIGCEYAIPRAPNVTLDPSKATVRYTPAGGAPEALNRVATAAACGGPKDWYFDNPVDPKKVSLCPAACTSIGSASTGKVDVLIACGGIVPR